MRRTRKQALCLTGMILTALLTGCGDKKEEVFLEANPRSEKSAQAEEKREKEAPKKEKREEKEKASEIYVYVCGEVASPGVYKLPSGSRIFEAVAAAGGLLDTACQEAVNQAEKLEDGEQIFILSEEEWKTGRTDGESKETTGPAAAADFAPDGRVDLNTADEESLMSLTGIGKTRAAAIIRYREENGGFQSVEEIKEIEGIKEKTYQKIKDRIKI